MPETAPQEEREQGWLGPIAAFLLLWIAPLVAPLRLLLPIEQSLLLLVPSLAVCAALGWLAGGRIWLALIWGALAIWSVLVPLQSGNPHLDQLQAAWCLLLPATFGLVCLTTTRVDFLSRALTALVVSLALCGVMFFLMGTSYVEARDMVTGEFVKRIQDFADALGRSRSSPGSGVGEMLERNPMMARAVEEAPRTLLAMAPRTAAVFPALLALQSLAVLALAWALFHRLSRARIGPPIGKLREFRFDDRFVWGLLAGLCILLLPSGNSLRDLGWILAVFFAGLYVVRGLAVSLWLMRARRRWVRIVVFFLMLALPVYALGALLGLGVGDTWADWRRRAGTT